MSETHLFAGIDDGHRETKIRLSNGVRLAISSRAMSGLSNQISLNGSKSGVYTYQTGEGPFSLGDVESAEDTAYDDYPVSAQNRVIVAHALRQAGLGHHNTLDVVTGLPLKRFYLKGQPNKDLIDSKKANLLNLDVKGLDGYQPAIIKRHDVLSEAIAAWVNYVLTRKDGGKIVIDRERVLERTALVDIGGRTLDIAVVRNWVLDGDRSTTDEIGMIKIISGVKERLYDFFKGVELSDEQVEFALNNRTVKVRGRMYDVGDVVDDATLSVVNSIKATVKRHLRTAQDIDNVFFLGGTTEYLKNHLNGWFEQQRVMEDPAFANAEGMLKYAEFVMGRK
ncbi:ParM/StbA family protein [Pseudomonas fluorescens]|nr:MULTISPECIES: ParM/StbA family protein [Pseudomonas]MBD8089337.1 ParM/StbA family protein [Pseudomonas fluorescens]MBD8615236.1 ParM/StbA family protein [Pseudomonas putida]MBD8682110.1 ParM/StbA family protein [Pseudomonas sp. CFBP 13719]